MIKEKAAHADMKSLSKLGQAVITRRLSNFSYTNETIFNFD